MSGAGRGVTPGTEPEAGQGESAASPEPERGRPSSADSGAEAPDQAESKAEVSGQTEDGGAAAQVRAQTAEAQTAEAQELSLYS